MNFDGAVVKIGIGRPARDSRIGQTLATLRGGTLRLLNAIACEVGQH